MIENARNEEMLEEGFFQRKLNTKRLTDEDIWMFYSEQQEYNSQTSIPCSEKLFISIPLLAVQPPKSSELSIVEEIDGAELAETESRKVG